MKIIIENGGTKLDWIILGLNVINTNQSINIYASFEVISDSIKNIFHEDIFLEKDLEIDFYTTGFNSTTEKKIKHIFQTHFNVLSINVFSDMLAASRALFNNQKGIACILGTGSNCAYFDGFKNHNITISLGHLLGDEGSAYHLGKAFLINYFQENISIDLRVKFEKSLKMNRDTILSNIYIVPNQKLYIASFSKFLKNNISDSNIRKLVQNSFNEFLLNHPFKIPDYKTYTFGFVGGVAFHFQEILVELLDQKNIKYLIIKKPINNLIKYYN